nr:hypothetical protein CFP56_13237 [Quercus suber]
MVRRGDGYSDRGLSKWPAPALDRPSNVTLRMQCLTEQSARHLMMESIYQVVQPITYQRQKVSGHCLVQ